MDPSYCFSIKGQYTGIIQQVYTPSIIATVYQVHGREKKMEDRGTGETKGKINNK